MEKTDELIEGKVKDSVMAELDDGTLLLLLLLLFAAAAAAASAHTQ